MELLALILIVIVFGCVYINIAPFIYSETFGHYLRIKYKHFVRCENSELWHEVESETLQEKCNPWLMFFGCANLKPHIHEYNFDSIETEELWNRFEELQNGK